MTFVIPGHRCHKSGREKGHTSFFNLPMFFSLTKTQNDTKYALKTVVTSNLIFFPAEFGALSIWPKCPPALLWEKNGRCKPGTEGPVGEYGDLGSLFKNHLFYCIFGFFITLQLLRLAGALVRNHTLLIDSRVRIEASKWNESESFVFVSSRLCSFLYFCWGFYCSVLDKGFLWLFFG